jgi:hypothetical protein
MGDVQNLGDHPWTATMLAGWLAHFAYSGHVPFGSRGKFRRGQVVIAVSMGVHVHLA